jgi:hypothetical protein
MRYFTIVPQQIFMDVICKKFGIHHMKCSETKLLFLNQEGRNPGLDEMKRFRNYLPGGNMNVSGTAYKFLPLGAFLKGDWRDGNTDNRFRDVNEEHRSWI